MAEKRIKEYLANYYFGGKGETLNNILIDVSYWNAERPYWKPKGGKHASQKK